MCGTTPGPRDFADGDVTAAAKTALRSWAHRILDLSREIADLDASRDPLTERQAPQLLSMVGIGYELPRNC